MSNPGSDQSSWVSKGKFQELDTPQETTPPVNAIPSIPLVEAPTPAPPVQLPTTNWLQELPGDMPTASYKN